MSVVITGTRELAAALGDAQHKLGKELAIAVNKTAKAHIKELSAGKGPILSEIAISSKEAKKSLYISKKATPTSFDAVIDVKKERRTSLRHFKAAQSKKGVKYTLSKREGRQEAAHAFIVEKLNQQVFKRRGPYVKRAAGGAPSKIQSKRIVKLHGISLYGLYKELNLLEKFSEPSVQKRLSKEIESRIRTILFRQSKLK